MLSYLKFLKIFKHINSYSFKKCEFGNNINNSNLFICSFTINQYNPYSVASNEDERFPLSEIDNFKFPSNYDNQKVSEIVNELLLAKSTGKKVPEYFKLSEIDNLLECVSYTQRKKYLTYLFKKEKAKLNSAEKKLKQKLENKNTINVPNSDHIQYGLGHNTLLLKTWKRSVIKFYEKRLANSVLFGQKIVIDLSYDEYMSRKERKACAAQLRLLCSHNKYNQDPYDLYFCNADPKSECVKFLHEDMSTVNQSLQMLYEESYLDLFPKENLVYLSPHASETLKSYDHKAIYIIGAFVDTVRRVNVSMKKAEEEGIKSFSLPLDDYILWGCGSRSLSIDQSFSIMQTMRDTGDWKEAFKHVPTRKLKRIQKNSQTQIVSDKLFVLSN